MNELTRKAYIKWGKIQLRIKQPNNDFERCRLHYLGVLIILNINYILYNFISFFIFPIAYLLSFRNYKGKTNYQVDALIVCPDYHYLLNDQDTPDKLKRDYPIRERYSIDRRSLYKEIVSCSIDKTGRQIVNQCIKKYPFAFFMNLSVLLQLSRYHKLIVMYSPKAFITTQTEQSFTTSLITYYSENLGIKFIGVQHGEYCYNPSMAYVRFSEYYAWNQETIDNLELANSTIDYAFIYAPERLKPKYFKKPSPQFFLTYYLSGEESPIDVQRIKNVLLQFTKADYCCCVRQHPRSIMKIYIDNLFYNSGIVVEDNTVVSLGESISNTKFIVAYRSTVLSEGFANSMPIIVDDVVGDISFLELVHDVNLTRATMKLSDLLKKYAL